MQSAPRCSTVRDRSRHRSFANGRLYTIGMTGIVTAWDAASGKQLWQKPGSDAGADVHDAFLLARHRRQQRDLPRRRPRQGRAHGVRRRNRCRELELDGRRSRLRLAGRCQIGGTRQVITITQAKLVGVDASNGTLLWERPFVVTSTTNSMTPIVYGQTVIVCGNGRPIEAYAPARQGATWVARSCGRTPTPRCA